MKKVSFNNIVTVKYYSVNKKKRRNYKNIFKIIMILIISLGLLYLYL